jgi:hypothetical protein
MDIIVRGNWLDNVLEDKRIHESIPKASFVVSRHILLPILMRVVKLGEARRQRRRFVCGRGNEVGPRFAGE